MRVERGCGSDKQPSDWQMAVSFQREATFVACSPRAGFAQSVGRLRYVPGALPRGLSLAPLELISQLRRQVANDQHVTGFVVFDFRAQQV